MEEILLDISPEAVLWEVADNESGNNSQQHTNQLLPSNKLFLHATLNIIRHICQTRNLPVPQSNEYPSVYASVDQDGEQIVQN